ncbi:MAG: CPBP family intramembrane glutamic endopeptidase [Betaproteobacteria bacterium]
MISLTRKWLFWVAYAALSVASLAVAIHLFPRAIPLVNLDVRMNRAEALAAGEALAVRYKLAPVGARSAVRFDHDGTAQNYIELEGGGRAVFATLTRGDVYAPYWWAVRLFAPGTIDEAAIRFKPDGTPDGFARQLPEAYVRDPATKALDAAQARELAETRARADWNVDFARYTLRDHSQRTLTSGRVDHTFVYERPEQFGEARVRLRLAVAGDELSAVLPFVFVPEAFGRRFQELRSANELIAGAASVTAGLLYGVVGCIFGSLWLMRRHWLVWRPAFVAGLVVASLLALSQLAAAPAAWFTADTTETATTFWLKQGGAFLFVLCGGAMFFTLAFMASESLARRAFPEHPQLWRVWSRDAGATAQIAGRTAGGYLFVPLELALVALFYFATNRWLGWWQPSDNLSDPNILASAIPALSPIAVSLQAGFWEECVFRAIPLALGALIGQRFGRRRMGIAIAFVLQAVVFGAAHANYPGLPSYSRLVELVLPSMLWGLIFLRFGLLPTIILHVMFDLVLFAIPVFLVDAAGAWAQQALIVAAGLVPAGVVLWRRLRAGAWTTLPGRLRNGAWQPGVPAPVDDAPAAHEASAAGHLLATQFQRALPALGLAGLAAWIAFTPFRPDAPALALGREEAVKLADEALAARGVSPGAQWRRLSVIRLPNDDPAQWNWHKFVWREKGRDAYRGLVGNALPPPLWEVRYATFDGDVAERAEEWRVTIAGDGTARTIRHQLPQARDGARLSQEAAQAIALQEVKRRFGLDAAALRQVGADEDKRQNRTDWSFMFADPAIDVGAGGELRYVVTIAGDELTGAGRIVHVPETWTRGERERDNRRQVVRMSAGVLFMIAGFVALILGIVAWTKGRCDTRAAWWVGGVSFALAVAGLVNAWPQSTMGLRSAEPVASQYAMLAMGALAGGLISALLFGVVAGIGAWYARSRPRLPLAGALPPWGAGVAAGLLVAGVQAIAGNLGPQTAPLWPSAWGGSLASPLAGTLIAGLGFISAAGIALFILYAVARLTREWTRHAALGMALIVALQCAAVLAQGGTNLGPALAAGLAAGTALVAVLWLLLRYDASVVPPYLVTGIVLATAARTVQEGTARAYLLAAVGIAATAAVAWVVTRYVATPLPAAATPAAEVTASSPSTA